MIRTLLLTVALAIAPNVYPDNQTAPGDVNPDVSQSNIDETICMPGWSRQVRPPLSFTAPVKSRLLHQQYPGAEPQEFELDHRVPIEDGGCTDCLSNLWLQPWRDPQHHTCKPEVMMDAACKDRLENYVHHQICIGHMTLEEGQAIFLGDWIAAYDKYIGGEKVTMRGH